MSTIVASFWRRLSKAKQFNEGTLIKEGVFSNQPFKNNYTKLVQMYMLRNYHFNNTPYETTKRVYGVELARLQHQLNFLNGRQIFSRVLLVYAALITYFVFFHEEDAKDWGDKFDVKFNSKAYGAFDDSSGEGNTEIDDWIKTGHIYHYNILFNVYALFEISFLPPVRSWFMWIIFSQRERLSIYKCIRKKLWILLFCQLCFIMKERNSVIIC